MKSSILFAAAMFFAAISHAGPQPIGGDVDPIPNAPDADAKALRANPDRSYPPSCLSDPLPETPRGPTVTRTLALGGADAVTGAYHSENLNFIIWRAACSNGRSALLLRIDRLVQPANKFPAVPEAFAIAQGQTRVFRLRQHRQPNTIYADDALLPIAGDATFVLDTQVGEKFDFNGAFTLTLRTAGPLTFVDYTIPIPAYVAGQHPDVNEPLEISGYVSGSWFDAAKPGEGMIVEIGERDDGKRFAAFAWYTFDNSGAPLWLVGNADLAAGAKTATIPALYVRGGGFAGDFLPSRIDAKPWGSVTLSFPNCNAMKLDFASSGTIAGVPTGSGTRNWQRALSLNGLVCQ